MSRAFVVQDRRKLDLSAALEFGELVLLLPENNNVLNNPRDTLRRLERGLSDFSDDDYLLAIGDPSAIALAAIVAARANNGRLKMLRWDNVECKYLSITLDTR